MLVEIDQIKIIIRDCDYICLCACVCWLKNS